MRALIQRVKSASVHVDSELISEIGPGLLTLLGIAAGDSEKEVDWMVRKIVNLRVFEDSEGKMNRSLLDIQGAHLIVSQFTLFGDCSKGNRPSFLAAARPEQANPLYERALTLSRELGLETSGGKFQATMLVSLANDGPTTLILETPTKQQPFSV